MQRNLYLAAAKAECYKMACLGCCDIFLLPTPGPIGRTSYIGKALPKLLAPNTSVVIATASARNCVPPSSTCIILQQQPDLGITFLLPHSKLVALLSLCISLPHD